MYKFLGYSIGAVLVFILIVAVLTYTIFSYGFVGMHLWNWFLVPVLGLPTLTLLKAYGISATIKF